MSVVVCPALPCEIFFGTPYFSLKRQAVIFFQKTRYLWWSTIKTEENCLQVCVSNTLIVNILVFLGKFPLNFFSSKHQEQAEENKQETMTFRKGLGKIFPFPVNSFPTFRLARKLLFIVGGVLLIALRAATVLHCNTIRPTETHLLNRETWREE